MPGIIRRAEDRWETQARASGYALGRSSLRPLAHRPAARAGGRWCRTRTEEVPVVRAMGKAVSAAMAAVIAITATVSAQTVDVYVYSFDFSVNPPGQPVVDPVIGVGQTVRWVWLEGNHTTTSVALSL